MPFCPGGYSWRGGYRRLAMIIYPLLLGVQLVLVSDTVPQFDASRGCHAATTDRMVNRSMEACRSDEDNAKKALSDSWTKYPVNDHAKCQHMITMGGRRAISNC
jgi:hypothetical protein